MLSSKVLTVYFSGLFLQVDPWVWSE